MKVLPESEIKSITLEERQQMRKIKVNQITEEFFEIFASESFPREFRKYIIEALKAKVDSILPKVY